MKNKKNKKLITNLILLSITLIIGFIFIELTLNLVLKDQELWQYDNVLGSIHIPNKTAYWCKQEFCHQFTANAQGFIDDNFDNEKNKSIKRILIFGDSFMEALQVDISTSTHRLLENSLKEKYSNIEVYNFGVSNQGTASYLVALKKYAQIYKPDLIIFNIFPQNDLRNINPNLEPDKCRPFFEIENNTLKQIPFDCTPSKIEGFLRNFKSFRLAFKLKKILNQNNNLEKDGIPLDYFVYDKKNKEFEYSFKLNDKILEEAKEYSNSIDSKFLVVILTASNQINNTSLPEDFNKEYPNQKIMESCKKNKINCLDLLPLFKKSFEETNINPHFKIDAHWNEYGHKQASDEIYNYTIKNRLI